MDAFTAIAVVTAAAAILVWIMQKAGQSSVVAYLALGAAFGPHGFGLLDSAETVVHISEIGVVFLLFFIGLEFHMSTLKSMAVLAVCGAGVQCALTVAAFAAIARGVFGCGWTEAGILGLCVAISSTAIVVKAFEDRKQSDTRAAQASLAILLGQDLVALLAVAVMTLAYGGGGRSMTLSAVMMIGGLPALFYVSKWILPIVFKRAAIAKDQEAFGLCSLGACLLVAVGAKLLGASMPLGAFLGGLVFSESAYGHQIRADLALFKNMALALFFFGVGMMMDLGFIVENPLFVVAGLVVVVVVKATIMAGTLRLFRESSGVAASAGLSLSQVSEFAFVLSGIAAAHGGLDPKSSQALIVLAVMSMLVAPALVSRSLGFGQWVGRRLEGERGSASVTQLMQLPSDLDSEVEAAASETQCRAIVAGYGPVGRTLCKILIRFGIDPCVIDLNPETVKKLKALGREAVFGDASRREVLDAAGLSSASYMFVTLPDLLGRSAIIATARALNPRIIILSRARYLDEKDGLLNAGTTSVAYEEAEVAAELGRLILEKLEIRRELIDHELAKLRAEIATRTGFTQILRRPVGLEPGQSGMFKVGNGNDGNS